MNTYKLTTILFAIVSAYFIYDKFFVSAETNSEYSMIQNDYEILTELLSIDKINFQETKIDGNTGDHLPISIARGKQDDFKRWNDLLLFKKVKPYGFAFGLNKLESLQKAILQENDSLNKLGLDTLVGVRVYLTRSEPNRYLNKKHLDLLFVPVFSNGKDYMNDRSLKILGDTTNFVLNTSMPCPEFCDQ